eukprot:SM000007S20849  [mRNA]  locus=s7:512398:513087:- [translate_table: standard]
MGLANDQDLAHPTTEEEAQWHKLKRLVPSPNSYFMDVRCPACTTIATVFSHSQTTVACKQCAALICTPTGGKVRLVEGCKFRKKWE